MKTVRISPWAKLSLALLLLVVSFLTVPAPAYAICCGWETEINYYADSAKTIYCGTCWTYCDGYSECVGVTGPYRTISRTCCGPCYP
jgi:hypothetical protein